MRGGSSEDRPGRWAAWLGALVAVALVDLLARLGRRGLWLDEAVTWDIANGSLGQLADQVAGPEMNGASHYVVLWAWARLTPDTEAWLRVPSAIVAACAVAAIAHLVRRRLGRGAAIAAGALLMSQVLWLSWGQHARQ